MKKQDLKKLIHEIIAETPIDSFQTIGDFSKNSSFNKTDRALVTHPTPVKKVKDFFQNNQTDFDFYFVNSKEARKISDVGEVKIDFLWDKLKLKPEHLTDGTINDNNITVFFTNNTGDERMPLTAWTIAHRFGHAIRRLNSFQLYYRWLENKIEEILTAYGVPKVAFSDYGNGYGGYDDMKYKRFREYELAAKNVCQYLGVFKSARDKNLRNAAEFAFECFAQYLKGGERDMKFNPLPDSIVIGHAAFGRQNFGRIRNRETVDECINELQRNFTYYAEDALSEASGRIFVM